MCHTTRPIAMRPTARSSRGSAPTPRDLEGLCGLQLLGDHHSRLRRLIHRLEHANAATDQRRERRYSFGALIHLTPVDEAGPNLDRAVVTPGKSISSDGIGFYHRESLPFRKVVASLELSDDEWIGLLVDLSWCRFTRLGWYESGGRILCAVASPLAESKQDASNQSAVA